MLADVKAYSPLLWIAPANSWPSGVFNESFPLFTAETSHCRRLFRYYLSVVLYRKDEA